MKKELVVHGHWPLACVDLISYFDKIRNEEECPKNLFENWTITSSEQKTLCWEQRLHKTGWPPLPHQYAAPAQAGQAPGAGARQVGAGDEDSDQDHPQHQAHPGGGGGCRIYS